FRSIFLHIHFTHSKIMKILNENMSDNIGVIILKKFLLIPVTICLLVIMSSCAPTKTIPEGETEVYEWRMVTHQIPGTARYDGTILPFVEAVEEITDGRLIIDPYGADTLFPTNDSFDMVKNGVVEMGAVYTGFWTG